MKNYLAVTIGPIYDTFKLARATREAWSASFMFSNLCKSIIEEVEGLSKENKLLSPSKISKFRHGAGVYPDRCFFELGAFLSKTEIEDIKKNALEKLNTETGIDVKGNFFEIHFVQQTIDKYPIGNLNEMLDATELNRTYTKQIEFDIVKKYWDEADKKERRKFFQKLYAKAFLDEDRDGNIIDSKLLPKLKIKNNDEWIKRFKSIPEISTHELSVKDLDAANKYWSTLGYQSIQIRKKEVQLNFSLPKKTNKQLTDKDEIIDELKKSFGDEFKFRHKYYSIVQADGDNVGKLIAAVERIASDNPKENLSIINFSIAINDFIKEAVRLLVEYGAYPIYLGGDDLLFFAPSSNNSLNKDSRLFRALGNAHGNIFGTNIFVLLAALNNLFKEKLSKVYSQANTIETDNGKEALPSLSLSFGVSVGYYKQPMYEVMNDAYSLLQKAKQEKGKNYIAMKLRKHSGQSFGFGFEQEGSLFECFLNLMNTGENADTNFLTSVIHNLLKQEQLIGIIARNVKEDRKAAEDKLTNFFKATYSNSVHDKYVDYLEQVQQLIVETYVKYFKIEEFNAYENDEDKTNYINKINNKIYNALRFVHFLNAKDSDA